MEYKIVNNDGEYNVMPQQELAQIVHEADQRGVSRSLY